MPLESSIQRSIMQILQAIPSSYVVKIHGSAYGRKGVPDILWIYQGRAIFAELKQPGRTMDKLQRFEAAKIQLAGATHFVWQSVAEAREDISRVIRPPECSGTVDQECPE